MRDPKPAKRTVNPSALPLDKRPLLHVKCPLCERAPVVLSRHHVLPKSLGGADVPENLVWVCGHGTVGCHGVLEHRGRDGATGHTYEQVAWWLVWYVKGQPEMLRYLEAAKYPEWLTDYYVPGRLPYVCADCSRPARFITCDYCMGETIPVAESPVGREDRLAAEGHA